MNNNNNNNNDNNNVPPPRVLQPPALHPREVVHLSVMGSAGPILHRLSDAVDALLHHHATAREHAFPSHLMNELAEATAAWENHFLGVRAEPRGAFDVNLGRERMNYDTVPRWNDNLAAGMDVRISGDYGDRRGHAVDGTIIGPVPVDNRCFFVALDPDTLRGETPETRRRVVVPEEQMDVYW